jgi:hypothetical protein
MNDAEFPDMPIAGRDDMDEGNSDNDEDEEPVIPRDDNRPNGLEGDEIDLADTLEWGQADSALAGRLDDMGAGDRETAGDLDGPLSDYDALTDDQFSSAQDDSDRVDVTEHEGPDLNADDSTDDGVGAP